MISRAAPMQDPESPEGTPCLDRVAAVATRRAPQDDPVHLNSRSVLPAGLPFSEAVQVGNTLYLSGQIGNLPGSLELAPGGMRAEARQVMENIRATLAAAGLTMENIVRCTIMMADIGEWAEFNQIYLGYFEAGRYPARSAFGTSGLAFGARVEVECIATTGGGPTIAATAPA